MIESISLLLILALLIAFAFEFVNGFHDTANAVATVIYTNSLKPRVAVIWSGLFNFLGALCSSGAVAYGIVYLLPKEIFNPSNFHNNIAIIFAVLISSLIWNLGTWYVAIPASSSHSLIGSILGVGMAIGLDSHGGIISGLNVKKAYEICLALLVSPIVGFLFAGLLVVLAKIFLSKTTIFESPSPEPPPTWIRSILIGTCSAVSFAHGSNDGQKGMGLIMIILFIFLPQTYAIDNFANPAHQHIPIWVKISVALCLGLGTMYGWRRIVITVGRKIGKERLNYCQGAAAELTAASTIGFADILGLPVSTTHVLSSGIAGTMYANGKGIQIKTVKNILLAWLLTLPATIVLAFSLFFIFQAIF